MKWIWRISITLYTLTISSHSFSITTKRIYERPIVIVVPSYNNNKWYQRNLSSIFSQQYRNYRVIYIDDRSSDNTANLVEAFIKKHHQSHRVTLIKNSMRKRQLANHYTAGHMCADWEIMVHLDGDDWFAHNQVLQKINGVYANPQIWITWGQFKHWPKGTKGICKPVSREYVFRKNPWVTSHLRTCYAWLFKQIKKEDLLDSTGYFFYAAADFAMMMPMLEMAGPEHRQFIPDVLYMYNRANVLNVNRVNKQRVKMCSSEIRSKEPYKFLISAPSYNTPHRKINVSTHNT